MKKQLSTKAAPSADHILSQGLIVDHTIYVAGQVHVKPDGTLVEGTTAEMVEQVFSNISSILAAADANLNNIVKVVIYLTDMALLPELNEVYTSYFSQPYPVREAVCVTSLPLGSQIEISVVAYK